MFPPGLFIGMSEWIMAIGTTITATALIAIVALLWNMRDKVTSMAGNMALIEQKIDSSNKESNLRFQMVDERFAHLQSEVERQRSLIEEQRGWKKEE